jgi:hypothetical protein
MTTTLSKYLIPRHGVCSSLPDELRRPGSCAAEASWTGFRMRMRLGIGDSVTAGPRGLLGLSVKSGQPQLPLHCSMTGGLEPLSSLSNRNRGMGVTGVE